MLLVSILFQVVFVDTFSTYVFTFNDLVIFSYMDSTEIYAYRMDGRLITHQIVNSNDIISLRIGQNTAYVYANHPFSILIGDPVSNTVMGYYATDLYSRPTSDTFLTIMPGDYDNAKFYVFSQANNNNVSVENVMTGSTVRTATLDSLEYMVISANPRATRYRIVSERPIQVLSYGDQGYYIPAINGNFSGKEFFSIIGRIGSWPNDLNIAVYNDSTHVVVEDAYNEVFNGYLNRGDVETITPTPGKISIHADKNISCLIAPYISYTSNYAYLYRGIDEAGLGIGRYFLLPAIANGDLNIFVYEDSTNIILKSGEIASQRNLISEFTLNKGEYKHFKTGNTIYEIVSNKPISTIVSCVDQAGADFSPTYFSVKPALLIEPDTTVYTEPGCLISVDMRIVNKGNISDVINIELLSVDSIELSLLDTAGNALQDHNGDSYVDTDTLGKDSTYNFVLNIHPSIHYPMDTVVLIPVVAFSSIDSTVQDTAIIALNIAGFNVFISPDTLDSVIPGTHKQYKLRAFTSSQCHSDTFDIWGYSSSNYTVMFLDSSGVNPLEDHTMNDTIDIPEILPDSSVYTPVLDINFPLNAQAGDTDTTIVVVKSKKFPYLIDSCIVRTLILKAPAVLIEPDTIDSCQAGNSIVYPLRVYNSGNGSDYINIDFRSNNGFTKQFFYDSLLTTLLRDNNSDGIMDVNELGAAEERDIFLEIEIPRNATNNYIDTTVVYARSSINPSAFDSAMILTRVIHRAAGVLVLPDSIIYINPHDTALFELRIVNLGDTKDTFDISFEESSFYYILNEDIYSDVNSNGIRDIVLDSFPDSLITFVKVFPPSQLGFNIGQYDTNLVDRIYVYAQSLIDSTVSDSCILTTVLVPPLNIHNSPNPFKENTVFHYSIPEQGVATLSIYNRAGELVAVIFKDKAFGPGLYKTLWNGKNYKNKDIAEGIYFYKFQFKPETGRKKVVIKKAVKN